MLETKIFEYYAFGFDFYMLHYSCAHIPIHESKNSLISRIELFFNSLQNLDLQVTIKASENLVDLLKRMKKMPKEATVDELLAKEVKEIINKIEPTLDAELQLRNAYIVTPKRFHLDNLLKTPNNLLAKDVFSELPTLCKFDFSQACQAIAFGLPTAAVFHLMRATENVLRFYYCKIVKRGRVKELMWGQMIKHLDKRRDAPKKPILDHLDNIRNNFRNPTQHPEARYDIDEAQDLLSISIDVINRMIRDLVDRDLLGAIL